MNSAPHRTVLLAADRGNSIIGEIVDGETNAIAYSAYGEQSAQQDVETRLGFNGQLREANIGWYLLGNGYRAYNPRLMRFHSPDNLSPFGKGGLNAYMYCAGNPINRFDPTGHMWKLFKQRVQNFMTGGSHLTTPEPRPNALQKIGNSYEGAESSNGFAKDLIIGNSPTNPMSPTSPSMPLEIPQRTPSRLDRHPDPPPSPLQSQYMEPFPSMTSLESAGSSHSNRSIKSGDPSDWDSPPSPKPKERYGFGELLDMKGKAMPGWVSTVRKS